MVSKKTPYDAFLHNFNGTMEQNLLKLFEALVNDQLNSASSVSASKENEMPIYLLKQLLASKMLQ